jgi:hypothetical protein
MGTLDGMVGGPKKFPLSIRIEQYNYILTLNIGKKFGKLTCKGLQQYQGCRTASRGSDKA